jgi:hypothetical protein
MIRRPAVAGAFYPGTKASLEKELEQLIPPSPAKKKVLGLISPHAGYIYSGACAGKGFSLVEIPDTVIILGVNHRGYGHPLAVDSNEFWNTPLGDVALDGELRRELLTGSEYFAADSLASQSEHSLEVQVPFIQYLKPTARILPITIASHDLAVLAAAGEEIGHLLKDHPSVMMIASTDMSHYIDAQSAEKKDRQAIARILGLDPRGLFTTVLEQHITMCGVAPTVMLLTAAIEAGATRAEEACYTHSGVTSGDYDQVVGYFSGLVY